MCIRLIEVYAACHCLYFEQEVQPCASYGQKGHVITVQYIPVGYLCESHARTGRLNQRHALGAADSSCGSYNQSAPVINSAHLMSPTRLLAARIGRIPGDRTGYLDGCGSGIGSRHISQLADRAADEY